MQEESHIQPLKASPTSSRSSWSSISTSSKTAMCRSKGVDGTKSPMDKRLSLAAKRLYQNPGRTACPPISEYAGLYTPLPMSMAPERSHLYLNSCIISPPYKSQRRMAKPHDSAQMAFRQCYQCAVENRMTASGPRTAAAHISWTKPHDGGRASSIAPVRRNGNRV